ncbi:MAG: GTP-binding protein, partial [Pseudomonadota bacterium]
SLALLTITTSANSICSTSSATRLLSHRGETAGEGDDRSLVALLVEQIEFADVVIVNKASDVSPEQLAMVKKVVASLNGDAKIIEADHSKVELDDVVGTGLYDEEESEKHPLWLKELYDFASHRPETEEYGVESFVYRARRPFDPAKFYDFLVSDNLDKVIRSKGHFWLATRPDFLGELAIAGTQKSVSRMGRWWAAVPKNRWPDDGTFEEFVVKKWDQTWGDRRQEIVFIGIGMDQAAITAALDACQVPGDEFVPELWANLNDPFPAWGEPQPVGEPA